MTITITTKEGKYLAYAVLSTKVSQVLRVIKKGGEISKEQKEILKRGANLIHMIIEGASFSEGNSKQGSVLTEESLSVFGYALSALDEIETNIEDDYTSFFKNLFKEFKKSIYKKTIDNAKISQLIEFYSALGNFFRKEIRKERYWAPAGRISLEEKQFNEYRTKTSF